MKKSLKLILLGLVAVFVISAAGGVYWYYSAKRAAAEKVAEKRQIEKEREKKSLEFSRLLSSYLAARWWADNAPKRTIGDYDEIEKLMDELNSFLRANNKQGVLEAANKLLAEYNKGENNYLGIREDIDEESNKVSDFHNFAASLKQKEEKAVALRFAKNGREAVNIAIELLELYRTAYLSQEELAKDAAAWAKGEISATALSDLIENRNDEVERKQPEIDKKENQLTKKYGAVKDEQAKLQSLLRASYVSPNK